MTVDKAAERDLPPDISGDRHEFSTPSGMGVVMDWHGYYTNGPNRWRRKALPATCGVHRGPRGFANFLVSMQDRTVVFDPHVTGECVIALEEESARVLLDVLTEWLG